MPFAFDTAAAADTLQKAGFDPHHARAIVDVFKSVDDSLATKADLAPLATKADVANAIAAAERRLMVAIIGVAGVLFAALRLAQQ